LSIPVFHDDQHGTAIIASAALLNALKVVGKDLAKVKVVASGAGAAAIACLDMMVNLGVNPSNIYAVDSKGVIWEGREPNMEPNKARYAQKTSDRTLTDAVKGADVFLGCSAAGVLTQDMVKTMADRPVILALANPEPEIRPELAKAVRPDCIIATGRSDYPNQVNNVLCFPYIFRGALDVGATRITESMKLACVKAIAELAQAEPHDSVANAYAGQDLRFGPEYIIPKPFDSRLIERIAPAVAKAAMESGVATRPIADLEEYRRSLANFVNRTGMIMTPVFNKARQHGDTRVCTGRRAYCVPFNLLSIGVARFSRWPESWRVLIATWCLKVGRDFVIADPDTHPERLNLVMVPQPMVYEGVLRWLSNTSSDITPCLLPISLKMAKRMP
jgi:malate dehydrogenase (oxaloacetate-decarboxylating)(NADP+)